MKLNQELCSDEQPYAARFAHQLYLENKYTHRQLSIMKQENLRVAAYGKKFSINSIQAGIRGNCGYCFKFDCTTGITCPLAKKGHNKCHCATNDFYAARDDVKSKKEFLKHHKAWCKAIGLWQRGWK